MWGNRAAVSPLPLLPAMTDDVVAGGGRGLSRRTWAERRRHEGCR
jgi:hypothetical protein